MQTLLVEIETPETAKELTSLLSSMSFVKRVSTIKNRKKMIAALQEHETLKAAIVKNKNKAIAKYL